MTTTENYRETERKYLLRQSDFTQLPEGLLMAPAKNIDQYYINHHSEPYELRLRRTGGPDGFTYVATVKKGNPPDRLEVETPINPDTFDFWIPNRYSELISKQRKTLEFAAGHWALDSFVQLKLSILEAEGEVPLPSFGRDVTDDTRFTNYQLAQMNDAIGGHMPDSWITDRKPTDVQEVSARIEYLRQRMPRPLVIGIAGDTASGKTYLARRLARTYGDKAVIISQDDYYRGVTKLREMFGADYQINFDEPIAIDSHLLAQHLSDLQGEKPVQRPTYSMETSDPTGAYTTIDPADTPVIIVEGIHALDPVLAGWYDYAIFVNAPLATRIGRRLERDLEEGRSFSPEDNLRYLMEVAEPTYRPYAKTQQTRADLIYYT